MYYVLLCQKFKLPRKIQDQFPISDYTYFDFTFFFESKVHPDLDNALTGVFDVIERAELVTNDKYIVPRVNLPSFSKEKTGCEFTLDL